MKLKIYTYLSTLILFSSFSFGQLSENFEGVSFPPAGWATFTNGIGTTENWGVENLNTYINNGAYQGGKSAFVYPEDVTDGTIAEDWLVTPAVTVPANGILKFYTRKFFPGAYYGSNYELKISSTSQTNPTTFTTIQTWHEGQLFGLNTSYIDVEVNLSAYAGQTLYFAFVLKEDDGDGWLLDNININTTCNVPTGLNVSNVNSTNATLGWTGPVGTSQWEIEVVPSLSNFTGIGTFVNTNNYIYNGLLGNTAYKYRVRSICPTGISSNWSDPIIFLTTTSNNSCVGSTSFSENFENASFPPSGWTRFETGTGTTKNWSDTSSALFTYQGIGKSAYMDKENVTNGTKAIDWLVTSMITVPANGQLRFYTKTIQSGNQGNQHEIKISTTSQTNLASFSSLISWDESSLTTTHNVYEEKVIDLSTYAGKEIYIAFIMTTDNGDRWLIDNVNVVCKCPTPIGPLATANELETSAQLSWGSPAGVTQWEIQVCPFTDTFGGSTTINYTSVLTNPYLATGLQPNTLYKFQVRSVCTNGFPSDWFGPRSFETNPCNAFLPNQPTLNGTSATFTWQNITNSPVTLEYSTLQGTPIQIIIPSSANGSYTLTGLNPNEVYSFRMKSNYSTLCEWKNLIIINSGCVTVNKAKEELKNFFNAIILRINTNTLGPLSNPYSPESTNLLQSLLPYIDVPDPKLFNFSYINNIVSFSFSPTTTVPDITFNYNSCMGDLTGLYTPYIINNHLYQNLIGNFTISGTNSCQGITSNFKLNHINFCIDEAPSCVLKNTRTQVVKTKFIALLNKINQLLITSGTIPNGTELLELNALAEFISTPNPKLYLISGASSNAPFNFSFSFTPNGPISISYQDMYLYQQGVTTIKDIILYEKTPNTLFDVSHVIGGEEYWFYRTNIVNGINFCPPENVYCTKTNPNSPIVAELTVKLLQYIISQKLSGVTDAALNGTYPLALQHLDYYITDNNPRIYNFHSTFTNDGQLSGFSFSFSQNATSPNVVIAGGNFSTLNSSNYNLDIWQFQNTESGISIQDCNKNNQSPCIKFGFINHIEFCPDELYCKKHIAIVVDESGSISSYEAGKIRTQLKNFVKAQAKANIDSETNTFVSLIGLSNQDNNNRTDHITPLERISPSNLNSYLDWINKYGNRFNQTPPLVGVSKNSDYWSSGLQKALDLKADMVILITDGCQVVNETNLKNVMKQFNNHKQFVKQGTYNPHLYVIGIENGYYIDETNALNRVSSNSVNPNENSEISRDAGETERSAGYLKKSLKYLLNYGNDPFPTFPTAHKYDLLQDYFGHNDFKFFGEEIDYLYNALRNKDITCGELIPVKNCDNCISYQPEIGKEYLLSAWVKQERNDQVLNYTSDSFIGIKLEFRKANADGSVDTVSSFASDSNNNIECGISSENIIEGWQRIFKKFTVPAGADFFEIKLMNNDKTLPLYFDDIRIHPIDGSMKSFVYDEETYKLMSELDENNYATFYEYDNEGGLIRVKKETSRGIKTIQETRSGNVIKK